MSEKVNRKCLKASLVLISLFLISCILLGLFELIVAGTKQNIDYLKAGKRWSSDGSPYAVIAVNTEASSGYSYDQVSSWELNFNDALKEASVDTDGESQAWTWSASFTVNLKISGPKGNTGAEATVCAGDFFVFHNLDFLYGSGFLNDASNPMGVVLDEDLAWKIFGAVDIVGMTVEISDTEYVVTGVCSPSDGNDVKEYTYGTAPRMYMSYPGYSKIAEGSFTTYEAALPNPVKSFAKNIFDSVVARNNDTSDELEATSRFSLGNRFNNMKKLKYSWISSNSIEYPYWENEARVYDYRCAVLMIFEVVLAAIAVISLIGSIVLVVISGYSPVQSIKNLIERKRK